jgi:hypothetical protein
MKERIDVFSGFNADAFSSVINETQKLFKAKTPKVI